MKKIIILMVLAFAAFTISCNSKTDGTQMKTVMAVHDEVMPEMGKMGKLVGELSSKEDSTAVGLKYKEARMDLQEAHKSMMTWMQNFGTRFTSDEILNGAELSDEKQVWLNEEQVKIEDLREQINGSIKTAEELLKK
ncbi:hypothetical protein [Zobellia barbeyronii]|uniref:Viral A-type inclusion protein n=1 Tax=Zobellia barbeyronii TaxID=2748009 RepID=A0ABS5WH69_9FLAO|nr:hypothetical protein [Zobellia barbeyronii]MBT2162751.1 hypothetical protein [Zobellia barbeyronii]